MLGKKKKEEKPEEIPVPPAPTPIDDAKIILESKEKIMEFAAKEFKEQYSGIFGPESLKDADQDMVSMDLLFGIFTELRLIRELLSNKKE